MSGRGSGEWVLSDLVHVLAQLPQSVSLELEGGAGSLRVPELVGRAYGLEDRLALRAGARAPSWGFSGADAGAPAWAVSGSLDVQPGATMAEVVEALWPHEGLDPGARRDDGAQENDGTHESNAAQKNDAAQANDAAQVGDAILSGHRVAIVTNLPTHYRIPLFTRLAVRLMDAGGALRVLFLGAGARDRPWLVPGEELGFDHEFVRSVRLPVRRRRAPFAPLDLSRRLASFDPTIVIAGGFSPFWAIETARYARRRGAAFGIWSGETPAHAARGGRHRLRRAERAWLARRTDFGIAYGSLAARYLRSLAPDLPVVIGRNTSVVEVGASAREGGAGPLESAGGGGGDPLELVAVADVSVPGKGIETVVEALELLGDLRCRLSVIGTRPRPGSGLDRARGGERVRFLGPMPHNEVMAAYRRSDAFVFPSRVDPFGLALVEAMASELPVVVSAAPGAAADLAVAGRNCLLADALAPRSWADRIAVLARDAELRSAIAAGARRTIERRWTIDHAADAMTAGVRLGALASAGGR